MTRRHVTAKVVVPVEGVEAGEEAEPGEGADFEAV